MQSSQRRTSEATESRTGSLTSAAAFKERMLAEVTERAEEILRATYAAADADSEAVPERVEAEVAELVATWEGDLAEELELDSSELGAAFALEEKRLVQRQQDSLISFLHQRSSLPPGAQTSTSR